MSLTAFIVFDISNSDNNEMIFVMVLIFISLMMEDISICLTCFWPYVYFLLRNAYSDNFPIFKVILFGLELLGFLFPSVF